ncbi:MAG: site-specific DNA-methyltransferase [Planctomycetaceae bacterium]|nr:site-specific DNA-methyltransferase [Planctomycetaceae bacterium]
MTTIWNRVECKDCIEGMRQLDAGSVDLVFADPPFNIDYRYDSYRDKLSDDDYLTWSKLWLLETKRVLKPTGTFWLAIGDEYAAELKVMLTRELGLHCRSWVIWYYTFGVHCKKKFTRSHTHLFSMVKDPEQFTFNDMEIRVPSARQLVYGDKRANPQGRIPDNTWILRPQDIPNGFDDDQSVWYFARVCGTFKERAGWHGCQMPEQLLGRIIRVSSNAGEKVLDPFLGSGSTMTVAKKLGRQYLGFDISAEYVSLCKKRLDEIEQGDPLDGAADPRTSAPSTAQGFRLTETGDRKRNATE